MKPGNEMKLIPTSQNVLKERELIHFRSGILSLERTNEDLNKERSLFARPLQKEKNTKKKFRVTIKEECCKQ